MSLNPEKTGYDNTPRVLVPAGTQIARNYAIIDIGTQSESFQGNPAVDTPKIIMIFEVPKYTQVFDEKKGPEPLTVFQEYSFVCSDRSKIVKVMKAWGKLKETPKKLNLKPYNGQYCMVTIEHKQNKKNPEIFYSNIGDGGRAISPVMDEMKGSLPAAVNPNIWFDLDNFDVNVFNSFPKFIKEKIMRSKEWPSIALQYPNAGQAPTSATGYVPQNQPAQQQYQQPVTQQPVQAMPQAAPIVTAQPGDVPNF